MSQSLHCTKCLPGKSQTTPSCSKRRILDLPVYTGHPVTKEIISEGGSPPMPVTIFADGVRYSSQIGVKAHSCIGVWCRFSFNERRHLLCAVRSQMLCSCGCRGWCSLLPIWSHIAHSLSICLSTQSTRLKPCQLSQIETKSLLHNRLSFGFPSNPACKNRSPAPAFFGRRRMLKDGKRAAARFCSCSETHDL